MDPSGNAVAVWEQFDGVTVSVASNRYDAQSGSWGTAELIETGGGESAAPQVAIDGSGNAVAVWEQLDGVTVSISLEPVRCAERQLGHGRAHRDRRRRVGRSPGGHRRQRQRRGRVGATRRRHR